MKKALSILLVLLAFISVISPTVCAVDPAKATVSQNVSHPALWNDKNVVPLRPSSNEDSGFDGRIILIVVVALMGIIVSTALILLNVKYSKIRKEEEEEEEKKKGKAPNKNNK